MKPSIPKGTRDFSPVEMVRRNFIFKTIREVFERYGYQPIETPAMENLTTLEGKYGEEGDKLLFRILNSGPIMENVKGQMVDVKLQDLTEKGLRYDLTVPFARYVVQHQNEITFPFKRYQIQPVWRADKPQKGRYREFYQCDADVIGSDSLLNEVELVQIICDVFFKLKIPVRILLNNRKIISGIAEAIGALDKMLDIAIAIDKYDKIGLDGVINELREKKFNDEQIKKIVEVAIMQTGEAGYGKYLKENINISKLNLLKNGLDISKSSLIQKGVTELEYIFESANNLGIKIYFDSTLARGLNYYTGTIFEVKANNVQIGSICGGGRYDDLAGIFGLPNVSGVGISFGIDRIFDVMNELNLFEKLNLSASTTKVLLAHFGEAERNYCIGVASQLRSAGINTEIYPDVTKKIAKQFDYANKKQIPFVIVVGGDEMKSGELALKNMASGEQTKMKVDDIIAKLK